MSTTQWKTFGPSAHLSWDELACKDGTAYPSVWRKTRAIDLAGVFELIRAAVNRPISIRSAYRSLAHNDALRKRGFKAARRSQHLVGKALDLAVPRGMSAKKFRETIREVAGWCDFIGGVGYYKTFVHIDIRKRPPNGRLAVWNRVSADPKRRAA